MGIGPPKGGQGRTRYIASSVCLYGCVPVVPVVVVVVVFYLILDGAQGLLAGLAPPCRRVDFKTELATNALPKNKINSL